MRKRIVVYINSRPPIGRQPRIRLKDIKDWRTQNDLNLPIFGIRNLTHSGLFVVRVVREDCVAPVIDLHGSLARNANATYFTATNISQGQISASPKLDGSFTSFKFKKILGNIDVGGKIVFPTVICNVVG